MAATAKHFPGHGAVVADSHKSLPVDRRDWTELGDDAAAVPPAHRQRHSRRHGRARPCFPAVDPAPASLSRRWIQNALREELRFEGAVFTDDLSMGGAAEFGDIVARATRRARRRLRRAAGVQRPRLGRQTARRTRSRNPSRPRTCAWCACAAGTRPSAASCTPATPGARARICWRVPRRRRSSSSRRATHERLSRTTSCAARSMCRPTAWSSAKPPAIATSCTSMPRSAA